MNASLRRRIALPAAALVAGTFLGGCGVGHADEAASVNGQVVSESDVQTATREITADPQFAGKVTSGMIAQLLAYDKIAEPLSRQYGVAVSDGQVLKDLPQFANASAATKETLRTSLLLTQASQSDSPFRRAFVDDVQKARIEINPRYGRVDYSDPNSLPIQENVLPWIKQAALADRAAVGQQ